MTLKKIMLLLHNPIVAVFIVAVPGVLLFNWFIEKNNAVAQYSGTFIAMLLIVYLVHVLLTNKEDAAVKLSLAILAVVSGVALIALIFSYAS